MEVRGLWGSGEGMPLEKMRWGWRWGGGGQVGAKKETERRPHIVKKNTLNMVPLKDPSSYVPLKDPSSYFLCQILPLAAIISLYKEKRAHFIFTPLLLPEYCF